MATPQAPAKMRPRIPCCMYMCLLFFIITMGTVNKPLLVKADSRHPSPPSTLVLYVHIDYVPPNATSVIAASPSGSNNGPGPPGFGTIIVSTDVVRAGPAGNSPVLGQTAGQLTIGKDGSKYLDLAYVLTTPNYKGSITIQAALDSMGNGEGAITGGTGTFRWARGFVESLLITRANPQDTVFKNTLDIKYN